MVGIHSIMPAMPSNGTKTSVRLEAAPEHDLSGAMGWFPAAGNAGHTFGPVGPKFEFRMPGE